MEVRNLKDDYINNTIESIKQAFEEKNLQNTDEYKRLEKIQEKRKKSNDK